MIKILTVTEIKLAFMAVIKAQGTDGQVEKWYTASKRHAIIGCYAQTELR
jgi:acyl-CoA oxidase